MGRLSKADSYSWFLKDAKQFIRDNEHFCIKYDTDLKMLEGTVPVYDDGILLKRFTVNIKWRHDYPYSFPSLFEVGGEIPKFPDWHIHTQGSCCITVPVQEHLWCIKGCSLHRYFEDHVTPYLFNQAHRLVYGFYVNKEFDHGMYGVWEFYYDLFGTTNKKEIIKWFHTCLEKKMGKKEKCFCGRKARMVRCHSDVYDLFKKSERSFLVDEYQRLRNSYKVMVLNEIS